MRWGFLLLRAICRSNRVACEPLLGRAVKRVNFRCLHGAKKRPAGAVNFEQPLSGRFSEERLRGSAFPKSTLAPTRRLESMFSRTCSRTNERGRVLTASHWCRKRSRGLSGSLNASCSHLSTLRNGIVWDDIDPLPDQPSTARCAGAWRNAT